MKCIFKLVLVAMLGAGATALPPAAAAGQDLPTPVMRYEQEYPVIGYSGKATRNCLARLQARLDEGDVRLTWDAQWGYLPSMLKALDIDIDSQVLVYSKTSLQTSVIAAETPRAIYFNDDCYVGFVQHSTLIEFVALDADRGVVFYGLSNQPQLPPKFAREGGRCLTCHDTYSMMGGGVPRVLVMSSPVESPSDPRRNTSASEVNDRTPVSARWGGWYVTGHHGRQTHLGNLPLRGERLPSRALRTLSPSDRQTLEGYFDTRAYLSDSSDIPALMVMEHQAYIQNLIVRANFKARSGVARNQQQAAPPRSFREISAADQRTVRMVSEPLVKALFFQDAAPLEDAVVSSTSYARSFAARGPYDVRERTLRELDLHTRLFRYPLSYMVYTEAFEALPPYAHDYIDARIVEILEGRDTTGIAARIAPEDRQAVKEILIATHPRLGKLLAAGR